MGHTFRALGLLVALALPAALIATNVRVAFGSLPLYTYAFDAFDAPARTGVPREELVRGARGLIAYFDSREELLSITVRREGIQEPLFTEREALHFRDVKALLGKVGTAQRVSLGLLGLAIVGGLVALMRGWNAYAATLLRALRTSAYATVAAIAATGLLATLGGFNFLFLQFHLFSFSNDLWMGRATDRMVLMFPEAFFLRVTLLLGLITVLELGAVALGATLGLRVLGARGHAASPQGRPRPVATRGGG